MEENSEFHKFNKYNNNIHTGNQTEYTTILVTYGVSYQVYKDQKITIVEYDFT